MSGIIEGGGKDLRRLSIETRKQAVGWSEGVLIRSISVYETVPLMV